MLTLTPGGTVSGFARGGSGGPRGGRSFEAPADALGVGLQPFGLRERDDGLREVVEGVAVEALDGRRAQEVLDREAALASRAAVGREDVVRPRGVVAGGDGRERPEEDAPGGVDPVEQRLVVRGLDREVLGRVLLGEEHGLRHRAGEEDAGGVAGESLSDRLRALALVESHQVDMGDLPPPMDTYERDAGYIVQGLHTFVNAGYYSEWAGYGETKTEDPGDRELGGAPIPGWDQTDYPGPVPGHAKLRGYAVRQFRENDYEGDLDAHAGKPPWKRGDGGDGR